MGSLNRSFKWDHFVYGFFSAIIILSLLLASQYGDQFNFLKEQGLTVLLTFGEALNWKTMIFVSIVFMLVFKNLKGNGFRKTLYSMMLLVFSWALFDTIWIVKAALMGNYLFGSKTLVFPSSEQLSIGFARNGLLFVLSSFFALKIVRTSKQVLISLSLWILYWTFLFSGYMRGSPSSIFLPLYNPVYYTINFLPFITSFKEWTGKTWRKFLFA